MTAVAVVGRGRAGGLGTLGLRKQRNIPLGRVVGLSVIVIRIPEALALGSQLNNFPRVAVVLLRDKLQIHQINHVVIAQTHPVIAVFEKLIGFGRRACF